MLKLLLIFYIHGEYRAKRFIETADFMEHAKRKIFVSFGMLCFEGLKHLRSSILGYHYCPRRRAEGADCAGGWMTGVMLCIARFIAFSRGRT